MRQSKLILIAALARAWSPIGATDAAARGFTGGGRSHGGGGRAHVGGGAGARHASMPNLGGGGGGSRPSMGQHPNISRPNINRPSASHPNFNRPNVSHPAVNRPNISRLGGPQLDRPNLGGSISGGLKPSTRPTHRPTTLPGNRPNLPTTLPGKKPNLPTTLPGNRPHLPGNRPNRPSLPNLGGGGSNLRPGNHDRPSAGDLGDLKTSCARFHRMSQKSAVSFIRIIRLACRV